MKNKVKENFLRRQADRQGFILKKSKAKKWSIHNHGNWMIIDAQSGTCLTGLQWDLSLEDVEKFLSENEKQLK